MYTGEQLEQSCAEVINYSLLVPVQSVEEIKRLLEEARRVGVGAPGYAPNAVETDEYIDDAMDNMYDEGSLDYNE